MTSFYCLLLCGLLSGANAFTISLVEEEVNGFEAETVIVKAQLTGGISGKVKIGIKACTLSEFEASGLGNLPSNIQDAAENSDFSINETSYTFTPQDPPQLHMFHDIAVMLQDDDLNEQEETFVVYISVTYIEDQFDEDEGGDRKHAFVKIFVNPNAPDRSAISISNPTGGSSNNTVVESAGEWFLTLNIVEYPPEDGFSFQMAANGIGSYPAIHGKDFRLPEPSSVNISCNGSLPCNVQVRIQIIDDEIPEPVIEEMRIRFSEPSGRDVVFDSDSISIRVKDDDVVTYGFIHADSEKLKIKEGQSAKVMIGILNPSVVEVSILFDIEFHAGSATSSEVDIDKTENLLLSPSQNQTIPVHIADNNIESPNRFFKLKIKDNSQNSLQSIDPEYLTVEILDNDTDVRFGIQEVVSNSSLTVREGDSITVSVALLNVDLSTLNVSKLDDDFVVGFNAKILLTDATDSDVENKVFMEDLSHHSPKKTISFQTKPDNVLQGSRSFVIVLEKTSINSPLVQLVAGKASVTILDDDFGPPNEPKIAVSSAVLDSITFEIMWKIEITAEHPVDNYTITIIGLQENGSYDAIETYTILNQNVLSLNVSFEIDKVIYSVVLVEVCAKNSNGKTCSERIEHKRTIPTPESIGSEKTEEPGLSSGAAAAISIIVLLVVLCLIGVFLVIILFFLNKWKNYFPEETEEIKRKAGELNVPPEPSTDTHTNV